MIYAPEAKCELRVAEVCFTSPVLQNDIEHICIMHFFPDVRATALCIMITSKRSAPNPV